MQTWSVLVGDVRDQLATLADESVQCCVTSPPYWGLRDYGVAGQLGLEPTPVAYVEAMVEVFRGVWRVLKADGVLWLNLGDSYASIGRSARDESPGVGATQAMPAIPRDVVWAPRVNGCKEAKFRWTLPGGIKPKDLVGIPWMVAFALRADGWYLRSDIIWAKPNPMPESVQDRPTKAHEYVFLLSKSSRYYYDAEAITDPAAYPDGMNGKHPIKSPHGQGFAAGRSNGSTNGTRNARSVWTITTQPYQEAHFATFPEAVPERCIKAGSKVGDTVLDPFCGSGTTGAVALRLGREFVGIELNPSYAELARTRIGGAAPLFAVEAGEPRTDAQPGFFPATE